MTKKILNIKERILYFADYKDISYTKFFKDIGGTYGNFTGNNKNTSVKSSLLANLLVKYPELNPEWLLTGKGEMLKDQRERSIEAAMVNEPHAEYGYKNCKELEKEIIYLKEIIKTKDELLKVKDMLIEKMMGK